MYRIFIRSIHVLSLVLFLSLLVFAPYSFAADPIDVDALFGMPLPSE